MKLTTEQEQFVCSEDKRIILNAAAGTGKTTTIAERCKWLLDENPNQNIVILTFTHAARETIEQRVSHLGGRVTVRTLVSFAYNRLVQSYPLRYVGDGMAVARLLCERTAVKPADVLRYEQFIKNDAPLLGLVVTEQLDEMYQRYEDTKASLGYLSFADVVIAAQGLDSPPIHHLIVDEAQDLAQTQWQFVDSLPAQNLVLAGDPMQSLYGFNGANPELLPSLARSSQFHELRLTETQRVPRDILPVVNSVRDVPLTSSRAGGVFSIVRTAQREQYAAIAGLVQPKDVVLVRTNQQAVSIAAAIEVRQPKLDVLMPRQETTRAEGDAVQLATIHGYKGSEAEHVIVADIDTSSGGYRLTRRYGSDDETDKMLLYTAATRTTNRLTLMEVTQ